MILILLMLQTNSLDQFELHRTEEAPFGYYHEQDGTQWIALDEMGDGGADFFVLLTDFRAMAAQGSSRAVWIMGDHRRDSRVRDRTGKTRYTFDCSAQTIRTGNWVTYAPDGSVMNSGIGNYFGQPVVPGTVGASWFRKICG
jgi:hypothetical protein